jgi:phosphotransferase system IIB component
MGRPVKIKKASQSLDTDSGTFVGGIDIGYNNPTGANQYYGTVGGTDTLSNYDHPVLKVRVKIGGNSEADGYIIRQKGASKYLVSDGSNTGVCVLANTADSSLANDTMTITAQDSGSTEFRIKRMSNKFCLDFSDNRYLTNFFDVAASVTKSGGETTTTIELVQVDNYSLYG